MLRKNGSYKFSNKKHPWKAVVSVICGLFTLFIFIGTSAYSADNGGNAPLWIGFLGILCLVISISGLIVGIQSLKIKDIYYRLPIAGIICNGAGLLIYLSLYAAGILK